MKPVLVVENVYKKYSRNPYAHRGQGISDLFAEIFGRHHDENLRSDEFYAVDDASLTLYPGDSLALVGRNGSGKTTLLKMINRLIKLDKGKIIVDGRVQALINLGAGFEVSLSGRDNIFNAAALMGMGYSETMGRLDEIIDFANIGEFIDSPVGTYSSGMYARLGFSVAIHLNPQIILIDEILSVGDYAFQNKCFVKMHQLKKQGVTMILVSHSHMKIVQFCDHAIWLDEGKTIKSGNAKEVVNEYIEFMEKREVDNTIKLNKKKAVKEESKKTDIYGAIYDDLDKVENIHVAMFVDKRETNVIQLHDKVTVRFNFDLKVHVADLSVSLVIYRKDGLMMAGFTTVQSDVLNGIHNGSVNCEMTIGDLNLNPGDYVLYMPVHEGHSYLYRNQIMEFHVVSSKITYGLMSAKHSYKLLG